MLEKTNEADNLDQLYQNFNLSQPAAEEEFTSALDSVAKFLLFGTSWEDATISKKVPMLSDMPLVCKVHSCPFASKCAVLKNTPKGKEGDLLGTDCRAEKLFGVEQFSALVKELHVNPEQTVDVINVTSLVRLLIIKRRMDLYLSIEGMIYDEIGTVNQRTGQAYGKKTLHPLFKEYDKVEKQIHALQAQLMASRKDRASLAATVGKHADVLKDLFQGKMNKPEPAPIEAEFEEFNLDEDFQ